MKKSHVRIPFAECLFNRPCSISTNSLMETQNKFINIKY